MQNYPQASPRGGSIPGEKPLTPYEDRVIPTLRNNNKSRQDKMFGTGGADYYNNGNDDEQLNNSGSENSKETGGGGGGGGPSDSIVPVDQQQQQQNEYEQEMYDPMDGTEEMTEREVREAALMNDYLGKQIVSRSFF